MRNESLKLAYHNYLDQALSRSRAELDKGVVLAPLLPWYVNLPDNSHLQPIWLFTHRLENSLSSLKSYSDSIDILEGDPILSKYLNKLVGNSHGASRVESRDLLRSLLNDYLTKVPNATFSDQIFEELYSQQEKYLYSDTISAKTITPLINFEGDFDSIDLDSSLSIRKTSGEEHNLIDPPSASRFHSMELSQSNFLIEQLYRVSKVDTMPLERPAIHLPGQISTVLTTLRLFRYGIVGTILSITVDDQWTPKGGTVTTWPNFQPYYGGRVYRIDASEIGPLRSFYSEFQSFPKDDFEIAIRRFQSYYQRGIVDDRLIDSIIAFENLLLPEKNELALRLAIRVANLLAITQKERVKVFDYIKKAYSLRNDIVHGSKHKPIIDPIDGEPLSLGQFVEGLENYLRKTIVEMLKLRKRESKHQIIERLTNPYRGEENAIDHSA